MKVILNYLLDLLLELVNELSYRLGYLISEFSDQYDIGTEFVAGVKDYANRPIRAQVFTMHPDLSGKPVMD